jgi:dihydropyrimidine dehydrogenase (NAD+) subunit PreT
MPSDVQHRRLSLEDLGKNFDEVIPPYSEQEAMTEAGRCLFCYDAPCIRACPTHIDIPSFIKKIATSNLRGSARVILASNPLGLTCARVCPVEQLCEGDCVLGAHHKPIAIGRLQRHATDWLAGSSESPFTPGAPIGMKVAIVGTGPAGLACAITLRQLGYEVTCYEAKPQPGGLDTFGIVSFREPVAIALAEAKFAEQAGVKFVLGTRVGKDVPVETLLTDHDALFIGAGLGQVPQLGIEGEELPEVLDALEFIERTKVDRLDTIPIGRRVAVIGAGNTAIDAATASKRLGAEEVSIVYRRSLAEMPAYAFEYDFAKMDGVIFRWLTAPVRIVGEDGHVTGLECVRMKLGAPGPDGRARPEPIAGSNFTLPLDMVIKAVGQEGRFEWLAPLGLKAKNGRFVIAQDGSTSHPKVFAAGDCAGEGGAEATVVAVVEAGKRAAFGIDASLDGPAKRGRGMSQARILGAPIPLRAASASPAYVPQGVHQ